jgi:hypothetical protein
MTFVDFGDWFEAMGDSLEGFVIHERQPDKTKQSMYHENDPRSNLLYIDENFSGYSMATLDTRTRWAPLAGDTSDGVTVFGVLMDGKAWFKDVNVAGLVRKDYTFSVVSAAAGWSKVRFIMDWSFESITGCNFWLYFGDAALSAMVFKIINNKAYINNGVDRVLQTAGGADISPYGQHWWEFDFNNTTKKVKVFLDDSEVFAATGFNDYFNVACTQLTHVAFQSGGVVGDSTLLNVRVGPINVDWISRVEAFEGWFIHETRVVGKADGVVGTDIVDTWILRVDKILYPFILNLDTGDEIERMLNGRFYQVHDVLEQSKQTNIQRFEVRETR